MQHGMPRYTMVFAGLLLLVGCNGPVVITSQRPAVPTIGPVKTVSGSSTISLVELTANTNCAEVGEVVTFTIHIVNETNVPITLTDTPLVDVILRPAGPAAPAGPIQRWSETNQYPKPINPVLAPHEERTYQWFWSAESIYAQQQALDNNGIWATLALGHTLMEGSPFPAVMTEIYVGVGSVSLSRGGTGIRCAEMQH